MDIYVVRRKDGWADDEYDSFVVAATSASIAASYHPDGDARWDPATEEWKDDGGITSGHGATWPIRPDDLDVECIGRAPHDVQEGHIYCASFNAG